MEDLEKGRGERKKKKMRDGGGDGNNVSGGN